MNNLEKTLLSLKVSPNVAIAVREKTVSNVDIPDLTSQDITKIYNAIRMGKQVRIKSVDDAVRYYNVVAATDGFCMIMISGYIVEYWNFSGEVMNRIFALTEVAR